MEKRVGPKSFILPGALAISAIIMGLAGFWFVFHPIESKQIMHGSEMPSQQARTSPESQTTSAKKTKSKTRTQKTTSEAAAPHQSPVAATPSAHNAVDNSPGSIINQESQNYGSQTVINTPPSRVLSDEKLAVFRDNLGKAQHGTLRVVSASTADDVFPLGQQLCTVARQVTWGIVCPRSRGAIMGREAVAKGLQCYSTDWGSNDASAFQEAMKAASLNCTYHPEGYDFGGGIQLGGTGGVTIVIGSP